jgi:hypothetical protein
MDLHALETALHDAYLARLGGDTRDGRELLLSALSRPEVVMNDPRLEAIRAAVLQGESGAIIQPKIRAARAVVARSVWDAVSADNYREPGIQGLYELLQALKAYEAELEEGMPPGGDDASHMG